MRKKDAGKKLLEEVAKSNAEQIDLKKRAGEAEIEDDRRIAMYLVRAAAAQLSPAPPPHS